MSKAIMIPVKPIWCAKIMNGDKSIEVRKSKALYKATKKLIEEQGYAIFFMYCTKDKKHKLEYCDYNGGIWCANDGGDFCNGKVVAKFTVRKVEEIYVGFGVKYQDIKIGITNDKFDYLLLKKACLTEDDLINYLKPRIYDEWDYYDTNFYTYHIEDLVIFDRPRELCEFHTNIKKEPPKELLCPECGKPMEYYEYKYLTKAPQNFCYVESEE